MVSAARALAFARESVEYPDYRGRECGRETGVRDCEQSPVAGGYSAGFTSASGYQVAGEGGVVPLAAGGLDAADGGRCAGGPVCAEARCARDAEVRKVFAAALFSSLFSGRRTIARRRGAAVQRRRFPTGDPRAG